MIYENSVCFCSVKRIKIAELTCRVAASRRPWFLRASEHLAWLPARLSCPKDRTGRGLHEFSRSCNVTHRGLHVSRVCFWETVSCRERSACSNRRMETPLFTRGHHLKCRSLAPNNMRRWSWMVINWSCWGKRLCLTLRRCPGGHLARIVKTTDTFWNLEHKSRVISLFNRAGKFGCAQRCARSRSSSVNTLTHLLWESTVLVPFVTSLRPYRLWGPHTHPALPPSSQWGRG